MWVVVGGGALVVEGWTYGLWSGGGRWRAGAGAAGGGRGEVMGGGNVDSSRPRVTCMKAAF